MFRKVLGWSKQCFKHLLLLLSLFLISWQRRQQIKAEERLRGGLQKIWGESHCSHIIKTKAPGWKFQPSVTNSRSMNFPSTIQKTSFVQAEKKIIRKKLIIFNEFSLKGHFEKVITFSFLLLSPFIGVLGVSCLQCSWSLDLMKNMSYVKKSTAWGR